MDAYGTHNISLSDLKDIHHEKDAGKMPKWENSNTEV